MSTQATIKDMFARVQNGDSAPANGDGNGAGSSGVSKAAKDPKGRLSVERIYQKKTQLEHILLRPDTYIGSVEKATEKMWVYDNDKQQMTNREITYVPGLYKIFDEILVNAADNKQRDPNMDTIEITIDPDHNVISVKNNGKGIPIAMHKDEKMYVPTMIFGHLLTSSNFNDEEQKVTGGRNGYGAKLCNVFSTSFTVETASSEYKKSFKQSWAKNMSKASEPKVKDFSGKDYTKVTFSPDLAKFKMDTLDKDTVDLLSRRAYDIAGASWGVKVILNGKRIALKGFKDMCEQYIQGQTDPGGNPIKITYEKVNPRWEVACCLSDGGFQQISFVNSIATTKGGRHVEYVTEQVTKAIVEVVKKKNKGGVSVKPFQVKNHLFLFVNCLIVNPTFDSQTKDSMTLQAKNFGSTCKLSEKFITSVMKSGVVDAVMAWAKFKEQTQLAATSKSRKQSSIKGVPKLEDANWAGTKDSIKCSLILTEGDSAKALAVSGLSVIGRDRFGVFPLRGKLLNVREATHKQILENAEINNVVKILGLQYKKKYETPADMATLRYGKVMIMTDQDQDGSHIKGLLINFLHHNWPSLLKMNFIEEFITPIVKAKLHGREFSFYSIPEFEEWKSSTPNWMKHTIKYYKGLGTSTSAEAKEYFTDMVRHRIQFEYKGDSDDQCIIMAFAKKAADMRKEWLTTQLEERKRRRELGLPEMYLYEKNTTAVSYTDFVNKELVLFSNADNERSIPSLVDGLKPGQRKVLFTCFKRKDRREVKVAQLAGSVAEMSAYHHGEQSLMSTIVNLAQDYVGSNNINLLLPIGQFGTRATGGKDAASPRYIFTKLSPLARHIFNQDDDKILNYLRDDNQSIEPEWYMPILPMLLVNGASGIGTGWMTNIPNYNPREIVNNLLRMIEGEEPLPMHPWYRNYRGVIQPIDAQHYWNAGEVAELSPGKLEITELPIKKWTQDYREAVLDPMLNGSEKTAAVLTDVLSYHTDTTVRFVVEMAQNNFQEALSKGLHKYFKLSTTMALTSMVLYDANGCIKKYENVEEILREFFDLRHGFYDKRKKFLVGMLQAEAGKLSNQARFICEKCDGDLVVENKKRKAMVQELAQRGYDSDPVHAWRRVYDKDAIEREISEHAGSDDEGEAGEESQTPVARASNDMDFDYLLEMKISSLTLERKEKLLKERDQKSEELKKLQQTTPMDMWRKDLKEFLAAYDKLEKDDKDKELKSMEKAALAASKQEKGRGKKAPPRLSAREFMPSETAIRFEPKMDAEVMKKFEKSSADKKPRGRKRKSEEMEKDKDDDGLGDEFENVKPLSERLGASPADYPKPGEKPKKAPAKRKAPAGDGSPAKRGRKPAEGGQKKKKKKRFSWESDVSSDEESGAESDGSFAGTVEKVERGPRRAAAAKAVRYSQSDSDGASDSDAEVVFHDNDAVKEPSPPPPSAAITLKSDSEEEEIVRPAAKKRATPLDDSKDSDDFDDLFGDVRPLSERLAKPLPASSAGATKEKEKAKEPKAKAPPKKRAAPLVKAVATYLVDSDDDDDDFQTKKDDDDDFSPAKPSKAAKKPAAKKPAAAAAKKPAQPRKPKEPKASPAKKRGPAKKKKGSDSDSDVILSDGDDDDVSDFRASAAATAARDRPGRARAAVSYNYGEDSDGSV